MAEYPEVTRYQIVAVEGTDKVRYVVHVREDKEELIEREVIGQVAAQSPEMEKVKEVAKEAIKEIKKEKENEKPD